MIDNALEYALADISVFPCKPRGKEPLTEHGFKEASKDGATIRAWWSKWPDANIGAPCGANGWSVIDVDTDSRDEIAAILKELGDLPKTPLSRTGKGRQVFFQKVVGMGPSVSVREKVDVRSGGSYVILPPSVHPNGRTYQWQAPIIGPKSVPFAEMPADLVALLRTSRKASQGPIDVSTEGPKIAKGERHRELFRMARAIAWRGAVESAVLEHLRVVNLARCEPPLEDDELTKLARGAMKYGSGVTLQIVKKGSRESKPPVPREETPEPGIPPDAVEAAGRMDRRAALERIGRVLKTKSPTGTLTILIWAAQTHIVEFMESVFYLAFRGRTGSGKGTGVELCILLTPDGEVLGTFTEAYLASVLDEGRAVGIEEADQLVRKNPAIETLLRNGYRRGVYYGFMVPAGEGKKWEKAKRSLFGPKVYDYHTSVDSHLLGRTVVEDLEPDDSVDRAMDAEKKARHLLPVRLWLQKEAAQAKERWTKEKVDGLWDDPAFRERVAKMKGKSGRDHVIGALMLLTCDILGWDYEDDILRILSSRKTLDEYGEEVEVLDAIRTLAGSCKPETELATEHLLIYINDERAKARLKPLTPKGLGSVLKDLGLRRDSEEWFRATSGPNRDKYVIRPYRLLQDGAQGAQGAQKIESSSIWSGDAKSAHDAPDAHHGIEKGVPSLAGNPYDGGQHPDFMVGLERALEVRRYDPKRPVHFIVGDLTSELRGRGRDPDVDQLTAGVIKGMMPDDHKDTEAPP